MASPLPEHENIGTLEIPDKEREFEELVAVRGMEFRRKVEEKREMDVQSIKLRQCLTSDSKPLPAGGFTRLHDNQIWGIVMEYLTHSFHIDSARRTCPTFGDILLEKRATTNPGECEMSTVLKIMKKDKYLESSDSIRQKHVPWQLRLVSKSWQRATDQAFLKEFEGDWHLTPTTWWKDYVNITNFTNLDHAMSLQADNNSVTSIMQILHLQLRSSIEIREDDVNDAKLTSVDLAWSVLENSSSRSSLLQIIHLDEDCMTEMGISNPRILEFLDEYGETVKGLIVEWTEKSISWATKYLNLLRLVSRMPNLKALTIQANLYFYPPSGEEEIEALKESILRHRFPDLSSIEVLSVHDCYCPLEPIVAEIFSKCNKLKSVFLDEAAWEKKLTRALEGRSIEYLSTPYGLPLLPNHGYENPAFLRKEMMPWASQFPLRKIVLDSLDFITCSERISFVNLFGNALEYLRLPIDFKSMGKPMILQLPKLKHLNMRAFQTFPGLTTLDFLIPLQSLEHLEFVYNAYYDTKKNPEDKFHLIELKDFDALEKSNIWKSFPHLRIVKFDVYQELGLDLDDGQEDEDYGDREIWSYEYLKRGQDITKNLNTGS